LPAIATQHAEEVRVARRLAARQAAEAEAARIADRNQSILILGFVF